MTEMVVMNGRIWFLKQALIFNSFIYKGELSSYCEEIPQTPLKPNVSGT